MNTEIALIKIKESIKMNFRKLTLLTATAASLTSFSLNATETKVAVVNFTTILLDSKYGKEEQESFETLKGQMTSLISDAETKLNETANKFNDPDYLDSLSPEAEQELKVQFQTLSAELDRYQQQFYQVLNQAYMKMNQSIAAHITTASEKVAKSQHLDYVLNKDACFFYNTDLELTSAVIKNMDVSFDNEHTQKTSIIPSKNEATIQATAEGNK